MTTIYADVALSCYNDAQTLERVIESVLCQDALGTLHIVDDGSTDKTSSVLARLNHNKIQVHKNPQNLGLAASLNNIFRISTAKYIARIDADDEMAPGRLKIQVEFMELNQHIHVLGTNAICIEKGSEYTTTVPSSHLDLRKKLMSYNCLLHPTVMLQRQFILNAGGYDTSYKRCQDYELWLRLLSKHGRIGNLEKAFTKIHVRDRKTWKNIIREFVSLMRIAKNYRQMRIAIYAHYSFLYNLTKLFNFKLYS